MNTAGQIDAHIFRGIRLPDEDLGSYNAPLIPMAALLFTGALLWFKIDPTRQLILPIIHTDPRNKPLVGMRNVAPCPGSWLDHARSRLRRDTPSDVD